MYIYIHLPFCSSICTYCDFPKMLYDKKFITKYLQSLKEEIKERYKNEVVKTIYIGGGTPTCLEKEELEELLKLTKIFKKEKEIEFTIESNVESLTEEKIQLLKNYGVNRISLGVQSLNKKILKELNRHHTKEMTINLINKLKKNHLTNISIDYIYGINSNINVIKEDLNTLIKLGIPHISCYSLIIEEGTIFKINKRKYIEEEIEEEMYHIIEKTLEENNYIHYEISNYAKAGYQSLHNLNYWNNNSYYGFGLGAVSYINNIRRTNTRNLTKYLRKEYIQEESNETKEIQISNELILGLRKIEGINIKEVNNKYQIDILSYYHIKDLLKEGLLELVNNNLRIPKKYIYISNNILVHFIEE